MKDAHAAAPQLRAACHVPLLWPATSRELASAILTVLHCMTYVPLALLPALQDLHLRLGVVLATSVCLCLAAGNLAFHHLGIVQVFPKMLDTFLLVLYASMVPVAFMQPGWMGEWALVLQAAAAAGFMALTLALPCWDAFATEALKDRLPEQLWELPAVQRAGRRASLAWLAAMAVVCAAALPPVLLHGRHQAAALHIVCDYLLSLLPLLAAGALQWHTTAALLRATADPDPSRCEEEPGVGATVQPRPRAATPSAAQPQPAHGAAVAGRGAAPPPAAGRLQPAPPRGAALSGLAGAGI